MTPQLFKYGIGITSDFRDMPVGGKEVVETIVVPKGESRVIVEDVASEIVRRIDITVEEGAHLTYLIHSNPDSAFMNITERKASVKRNGSIKWVDMVLGGKKMKSSIITQLIGEGASARIDGLFFGSDDQLFDIFHEVIHAAPHTTSHIETKGALAGTAKTIYRNCIYIAPGAHHANGFEQADTLLLSDGAEINAIPDLDIQNNEVQCSHAVTTTYIDEEKKFYLESRGMEEGEAVRAVVEGHFSSAIEIIRDEALRKEVQKNISEKI